MSGNPLESLAQSFSADHPQEAARLLVQLPPEEVAAFLGGSPPRVAAGVARFLTALELAPALVLLPPESAAALLEEIPGDQVASTLRRLGEVERRDITQRLSAQKAKSAKVLLRFEEGSAGALMEPAVVTVLAGLTVPEARESVDRNSAHLRYYIYVVDEDERLVGVLTLRQLVTAEPKATVAGLMTREVQRISARAARDAILRHPGWAEVHALPVVDERNTLVGVLRHETAQRLARGENRQVVGESPAEALGELFWVGSQRVLGEFVGFMKRGTQ